jgi:hypothetical protein
MLHRRSPAVPIGIGIGLDHDHLQQLPALPASSS